MHYAEGSIMSLLVVALVISKIREAPVPFFLRPITRGIASKLDESFLKKNLETHFSFLEEQVRTSEGDFLCGKKLTGADILMILPLEASQGQAGLTEEKYPKTTAYLGRLLSREAYKRAVEKIKAHTGKYENVNNL